MITSWLTFNTTAGTAPAGPSASTARPARPSTARSYRKRPGSNGVRTGKDDRHGSMRLARTTRLAREAQTRMLEMIDAHFIEAVSALTPGSARDHRLPVREGSSLTGARCLELFDAQLASRHLDLAARWLRGQGKGFYTIASAGHEGNAKVAAALRPTDPALLHYRSGAFYLERARQVPGQQPLRDMLLGVVAAAEEPIAGAKRLGVACAWPADAVVVCSFGDASVNHSTATGAINAASHGPYQRLPLPLLLVCEDNGLGISVRTPEGWVRSAHGNRPGLRYLTADGCDLADAYDAAQRAVAWVRERRAPAFLHLRMVRFLGHAGSDAEVAYRTPGEIAADADRDPLVGTARLLVHGGVATPQELVGRYEATRLEVLAIAEDVAGLPQLPTAEAVLAPLAPRHPDRVAAEAVRSAEPAGRARVFDERLPEHEGPLTLALAINLTLADLLALHPELLVFGEDVGRKGGVYGVTRGLQRRFGAARVFDTLLDEQTILGLALGAGLSGLLPIPEIQYLAYLHNAEDQIRGEAATLQFFSQAAYRNPMVVRVAAYGYQKGFGGHFHNDNAIGVLRDVPGVVIASPARPDDAAAMLRTCVAAAKVDGSVCVFLEPIALYHTRDLHSPGDGGWVAPYPVPSEWSAAHAPIGSARVHGDGSDLTLVTFGNGLYMSLRVARRLSSLGIGCRVLDLRWLAPLPVHDLLREAEATGRVLVVDETRRTGGVGEGVLTALVDAGFRGAMARVASEDSFLPLGDAMRHVLLSEATIEKAATGLARWPAGT